MKHLYSTMLGCLALQCLSLRGQCPTDLLTGQNLVTNPEFSSGYSNWTFTPDTDGNPSPPDGYIIFNPPVTQNYSQPGFIYAGSTPSFFNSAFATFNDHSASADNMMLMVDGVCSPGIKLWSQSGIPISPNTNYYFSVWVHSLKDGNNPPGTLQFDIGGSNLPTTITAPTNLAAGWIQYETVWFSGATPPATTSISIENTTTTGCDQYVDFAIDDISFIPGCTFAAPGPQPNLGPDKSVCGQTGGVVTINAGLPVGYPNAGTTINWSNGAGGTGAGAPTSITVGPGTYSVCVTQSGGCVKSDVIVVTNTFSIDIGPDQNLCNSGSVTLDAGYTGPSVTYLWKKNGVAAPPPNNTKTYFVNMAGTYSVEVTAAGCGMQSDAAIITTSAPSAVNATFCGTQSVTLTVNPVNSGKYKWWDHPTNSAAGNLKQKGGNTYTFTASGTSNFTFYVEDTASFRTTIGPPFSNTSVYTNLVNRGEQNETNMLFSVLQPIVIDSVWMYLKIGGSCPDRVGVEVWNAGVPGTLLGAAVTTDITAAMGCTPNTWGWFRIPVNIAVPVGTNYRLKFKRPSNAEMAWYDGGMTYPQTYASAITFTGNYDNIPGWKPNAIPGMWRWVITAGTACARVPVQAIYSCPAPLNFISFEGEATAYGNKLNWITSHEEGTDVFHILKSVNGTDFHKIGEVDARGNSTSITSYDFIDANISGAAYYKIEEKDLDGTLFYSEKISLNGKLKIAVYPNPNEGEFTIDFGTLATFSIRDVLGRIVYEGQAVKTSLRLQPGLYYVGAENGAVEEIIIK